ncbi:MAG: LysM peptidoglycan-binding domain-containing protein, partial [Anaerolineae bacterium]|nr:LysM peptidoglycan-binding domain-containing protein [Anaerolineae bacterium]
MRKRLFLISLLASLALASTATAQDANTHVVQRGESLFRIATYYGTDVNTLAQLNGITNTWQIYAGQVLVLPSSNPVSVAAPAEVPAAQASVPAQTHTVGRGETLVTIARAYGLSPDALAQQNNITNPNLIYAGQQLIIIGASGASSPASDPAAVPTAIAFAAQSAAPAAAGGSSVQYTVQPGEYLSNIATRFGVNWTAIAQANNIYDPDTVFAGQTLIIPNPTYSGDSYGVDPVFAAPAPPSGAGREIVVDLSDSRVYAYENGVLVHTVLGSTGLPATPTVQGDFRIQRKY